MKGYIDTIDNNYKTAYGVGDTIIIKNTNEFTTLSPIYPKIVRGVATITITSPDLSKTTITYSGEEQGIHTYKFRSSGTYTVRYSGQNMGIDGASVQHFQDYAFYYTIAAVENKKPLKRWTITDVLNRLFDVCEPIYKGEKPRFRLQGVNEDGTIVEGSQADRFNKILAPQLSFTKQTLRECMQEVGKVVHGEPRLTPKKDSSGKYYFEVSYEMYGGAELSGIATRRHTRAEVKQSIANYCSHLDSHAENLVNQLDKFSGVISEPYANGYKTVRTESMYARIEEGNIIIPTVYPIYTVEKLEVGLIPNNKGVTYVDISPYLFEKSLYDVQLSSYSSQYPYSKAYGIYFTQGKKNIEGLNFKPTNPISEAFERYSIINILRRATGDNSLTLEGQDFAKLAFRVTYTPFYNSRVAQSRVHYKESPRASALIYNQQSNIVETHYYGENLKGAVARMGNIEKTATYLLSNVHTIPKAGQKFDKNYYISTVATEILPTCFKTTIGLSKDFNRLSQYIGISSVKRYSEVSESQAQERNLIFREYIVVGAPEEPTAELITNIFMINGVWHTFIPSTDDKPLTSVIAWGGSKQGNPTPAVQLPVISSAFGNSISFSWKYEDNYSAGAVSHFEEQDKVSGYFQNNAPYCDYYGRIYYYWFALRMGGASVSDIETQTTTGCDLPQYKGNVDELFRSYFYLGTQKEKPIILRKDSREILQVNMQIDFVTNDSDMIIGSALASYSPMVRGHDEEHDLKAKLYVFDRPLNKFIDQVSGSLSGIDINSLPSKEIAMRPESVGGKSRLKLFLDGDDQSFPASGKSWAIVTAVSEKSEDVEDEEGNITTQTIQYGGNVLIAKNTDVVEGQAFEPVFFTPKREVFDKTVWKDVV